MSKILCIAATVSEEMLISVAPLPRDMSATSTDPLLCWAKRILEGNDGGNLEYTYHLEPGYNTSAVYALTDFVKNLPDAQNP